MLGQVGVPLCPWEAGWYVDRKIRERPGDLRRPKQRVVVGGGLTGSPPRQVPARCVYAVEGLSCKQYTSEWPLTHRLRRHTSRTVHLLTRMPAIVAASTHAAWTGEEGCRAPAGDRGFLHRTPSRGSRGRSRSAGRRPGGGTGCLRCGLPESQGRGEGKS